jgi:hypothetical protein
VHLEHGNNKGARSNCESLHAVIISALSRRKLIARLAEQDDASHGRGTRMFGPKRRYEMLWVPSFRPHRPQTTMPCSKGVPSLMPRSPD